MEEVLRLVDRVAPTDSSVLVLGESGTGKELVARADPRAFAPRASRPSCPSTAARCRARCSSRELFGHEKGAFTGAVATKPGLIELADGGTLFLDEIGEMEPESQVKLLRVLESHAFFRVGGTRRRTVDMRLVAATNRDLAEAIKTGQFRQDLFYRINTITVTLPPLRERREDVAAARRALPRAERDVRTQALSPARAMEALERYEWPGNVRELQHAIQRARDPLDRRGRDRARPTCPPRSAAIAGPRRSAGGSLEEMERQHIVTTLTPGGRPSRARPPPCSASIPRRSTARSMSTASRRTPTTRPGRPLSGAGHAGSVYRCSIAARIRARLSRAGRSSSRSMAAASSASSSFLMASRNQRE